ncbi:mitochondrial escape protein 2 [Coemansia sp. RSA 1646]|nr:mitochondrial escape protein 2 [Coemansia sp. RSA 1646]KAJ1770355.1 mitochondrial escape protein 2 [Coemansia sp. RSA 1843]KAJ2089433.1 mitochondrial escape protein 2 [Coemansia sp. RSA 986]KAJ2214930.1 mitochondrial escape protein 2 [Coemansia sp. RSA 487]
MFISKLFPLKTGRLDIRPLIVSRNVDVMKKKVACLIPQDMPNGFSVDKIEPHSRDGGSVVYFTFDKDGGEESATSVAERLVGVVDSHLASTKQGSWFGFGPARSFPIKGVSFYEDIVRLLPSKKVRVEFIGPDLTLEQIYKEFRMFGRILDIEHQPSSNKDTPRWAVVHFVRLHSATSARNCLHGYVVNATKIILSYVKDDTENAIVQWVKEHTKFTVPLAAAALIAAIYAVFDPIREFFVDNKITHRFDLDRIPLLGNAKRAAMNSIMRRGSSPEASEEITAWSGVADQCERLSSILDEPPESFIVVTGPHGSGKTNIIQKALQSKKYRVVLDANTLAAQHSEIEQMSALAKELGWWPVFNSIISITNAIDLMITATTGGNAGISATPESQVRRILECLALVLARIRHERLAALKVESAKRPHANGTTVAPLLQSLPPEDIPVIVLDNFMDKDIAFTPAILDWAADVVDAGLAHFIFTTSNISGYYEVQRAQPQRAASLISLNDASPVGAIALLQQQLAPSFPTRSEEALSGTNSDVTESEIAEYQRRLDVVSSDHIAYAASVLGGRLEDLHVFVQKVNAGETLDGALEDIIQRSITEVRKYAFADDSEVGKCEHTWTPEQFWCILTELAVRESIEYDRIRNSPLFAGDDKALLGLAEAQLITMVYDNDRPARILPGRPVYSTSFRRILDAPGFANTMVIKMNKKYIELETAKIHKAEEELSLLNVFRASADTYSALTSSMAMISASRDARAGDGRGRGDRRWTQRWSGDKKSVSPDSSDSGDRLFPEAFIAQAVRSLDQAAGVQPSAGEAAETDAAQEKQMQTQTQTQSWLGWLFGRGSGKKADDTASDKTNRSSTAKQPNLQPPVLPGIPSELQGRVRFLLQVIHDSQKKIDMWDVENKKSANQLSGL